MAKSTDDQLWEINASVAALSLLIDHLLAWHFQAQKQPKTTAQRFINLVQEVMDRTTMPGFSPEISDASVGLVQDNLDRHFQRVLRMLEHRT